eukprot:3716934-Alexandrium_andersonii.AAC.1
MRRPGDQASALPGGSSLAQLPPFPPSVCAQLASGANGARHQDQKQLALSGTHPRPVAPCKS